LFKEIVDRRTHGRTHGRTTDAGRRKLKDHKSSLSTLCSVELKKANKRLMKQQESATRTTQNKMLLVLTMRSISRK